MPSCTIMAKRDDVHNAIKASYRGRVAGKPTTACWSTLVPSAEKNRAAGNMGYSADELYSVPDEANMGLGCGAPMKTAKVNEGMTVFSSVVDKTEISLYRIFCLL